MKDKVLKKLGTKGLIMVGLLFFTGLLCVAIYNPAVAMGGALLPIVFGMAATVTDGLPQVRTLKYAHTAALSSGDVIVVNGLVLIAVNDTLANAENVFAYITKATMVKKAALAIELGDLVYWDATPGEITKTNTDVMCGYCIKAALAGDSTVDIFLFPDLTNIGTAEIADGAVTSAKLAETILRYATVTITNAQIKALRATPKELVAAPGANKVVEFVSMEMLLDYGSNVLTETADNLAVRFENTTGALVSQAIEATGFIDAAADTITNALPKIDAIVASASAANKALVLHNTGDGEYAGNAGADTVIVVKIAYRIHDFT